jgi:hypothetical protein
MQQQEKEAKKNAAEKKRKEIEKKNNDPLALNYIQPKPEDIFVNPKAAQKALASKGNATDLGEIMKE